MLADPINAALLGGQDWHSRLRRSLGARFATIASTPRSTAARPHTTEPNIGKRGMWARSCAVRPMGEFRVDCGWCHRSQVCSVRLALAKRLCLWHVGEFLELLVRVAGQLRMREEAH